jgi:VWFA-related protein
MMMMNRRGRPSGTVKATWTAIGACVLFGVVGPAAAARQSHSGTGMAAVAVRAFDRQGSPVLDLRPEEFQLEIDGRRRAIVSARLVHAEDPADEGERILLVPDLLHLEAGQARPALEVAKGILPLLRSGDRVGLFPIPRGRPRLEFTPSREMVAQAIDALQGFGRPPTGRRFTLDIEEAFAIAREGRGSRVSQEVADRECEGIDRCDVEDEARQMVREALADTQASLKGLQVLFGSQRQLPGEKVAVLISDGLIYDPTLADEFARVDQAASAAQMTVTLVTPDVPGGGARRARMSVGLNVYATQSLEGLRVIAEHNGGDVHRTVGAVAGVVDQLRRELATYYLVAFEPEPGDHDGKPRRVAVTVSRPGVNVRARRLLLL